MSLGFAPTFLRRATLRLLSARSGSEALSLARASDPSLLLLEYSLPVLRGDEVCRRFKSSRKFRKVPVVIVGPPQPADIQTSCHNAGCDLFLPEPADVPSLLSRVAELLDLPDRAEPRVPVLLSVSYGTVTTEVLGQSVDLSEKGIRVQTTHPLRPGFYINLKFFLPGDQHPIVAPSQILRVIQNEDGRYEVGIRFITLPREALDRLQPFLDGKPE